MRRGRRAWLINGVLVVALVAAGWGAYTFLWPSSNAATPTGVRSVAATRTDVVETVSAAGSVESSYTGTADFAASGTITQINVKVGDTVSKGQQLAKLDDSQAKLQLAAAKSSLSAAKENLANASETTTTQQGQSSQQQSTKSLQAQVDQAEVNVDQAQEAVNATTLTAPGDGTVTAINGTVGQKTGSSSGGSTANNGSANSGNSSTSASSGFITITNLASLQVKANLAEIDVAKVKAGQDATVTLNAMPDTPQAAKVSAIDLTATTGSNNVVTYGVTLTLNTPPAQLRPGQSASVAITVAKAADAIAIPSAAMRTVGTTHTVNLLVNGQETSRAIEIGVRSESLVQVTSGLNVGDQVVLPTAPATSNQQERGGGSFGGGGLGGGGVRIQQPGGGGGTGR
ncbi:efflux RND transporter periplasmic adaptor subunit [Kibdelosporangium aridum]|uniref:Membrane fusion protein, macrolide-specific efflux system n=1 Tax=Kibdelosporangium aridum TaxID=2030 RepID=A0A1W2D1S4_KIBAR|nr:efflux RND transporter periplasmic adaptor subunit [Kibdelosporangium aridum]SMC91380.1 membrane fusion protein, macrolide-specific efflux system [Kibdelosporangium aridum]